MFSTTSFAEPKLSELVPTLTGESNFASWSTALKCALDTRDPRLFEILTGHAAQPAPEDPSLPEWTRYSRHLLSYLHATVDASLKPYINTAPSASAAYQSLYKTFAVHTYNTGFDKFHKWVSLKYDNTTTPQQFVIKWRTAYAEFAEACGHSHISNTAQYFLFLTAVSVNLATHQWLNSLRPSTNDSSEHILISTFSDFVISENRRLASQPSFTSDPVFYDANAIHNQGNNKPTSAKPKHFCTFHQRKAAHTSEECFRNPANANTANAAKLANAVNTTTPTPTTANAITSNPIVRFNNLFTA
ncbi:hypothetical protein N7471_011079 [Penicillium samsonianum]|uniref:uncharacterized protein n=1 Tax=Penicillium samsonianum TaxID=1882272 RepID=UPI002547FCD8|nr:uncharacterized protein N7471_011079 [Penicillium samsonianum]KAJ6123762.1 hypothetical protein N7471_011079 [Penicillium samsonianum]